MADDEKVPEEAFRESPEFGVRVLHEQFRWKIISCIKARGLGLVAADIDEVYGQTMLELLVAARRPGFDRSQPMKLAKHIAKQRTKDALKRNRLRAVREGAEYQDHVTADMHGTAIGLKAKFDIVDYDEFDKVLWEKIETLPPIQKLAATCFRTVYEDIREQCSYAPLADAMSVALNKPVSVAAAKSAWYEARDKIVEELNRRGFDL